MSVRHPYRIRRRTARELPKTALGIMPGFVGSDHRECQWIEGDPHERNFCGAPVRAGSSYCDAHYMICFRFEDSE